MHIPKLTYGIRLSIALLLTLCVWLYLVAPVLADGPVVTTAEDETDGECVADCSLRDAIALAANGDTITFAGSYTI